MADSRHITRRALIKAFPFIGAVIATPIVAREPAKFDLKAWLDALPPLERANYYQQKLAEAMCEASPGRWRTSAPSGDHDFILFIRDEVTSPEQASVIVRQLS